MARETEMKRFPSILKTDNKMWVWDRINRQKQVTAAETNNLNLDKDATWDRETVRKRERDKERCLWLSGRPKQTLCCQRARFSQTDTKLDPPLYSSKQQNTDTTSSVNLCLCLFEENSFFLFLSLSFSIFLRSQISTSPFFCDFLLSFICSLLSTPSFFLPCFYLILSLSSPSLCPFLQTSLSLCCPLHPISLIHNWTALTATEAKQSFN